MTERERLIELLTEAPEIMDCPQPHEVADHLLANGVIVPPCKVGDTVYIIEDPYTFLPLRKAVGGEVVSIHLHEHGLFIRVLFDTRRINGCVDFNLDWKLGKTVSLTKEEAEKALERSRGNGLNNKD